jgi:hypothetical protein
MALPSNVERNEQSMALFGTDPVASAFRFPQLPLGSRHGGGNRRAGGAFGSVGEEGGDGDFDADAGRHAIYQLIHRASQLIYSSSCKIILCKFPVKLLL